jgi:hypothetical protein
VSGRPLGRKWDLNFDKTAGGRGVHSVDNFSDMQTNKLPRGVAENDKSNLAV